MTRPQRDETSDYYYSYIDQVPDGDIRAILEEQRGTTLALFESIPESLASHRYEPGKWSVVEVVSHINDCERVFSMRAFWFARSMSAALPSFESDRCVTTARPAERPWNTHLREFASIRAATFDLFRDLPDDVWDRRGIASDMPFSVRALAYIAAGHVIHHTRVLRERYLR